MVIEGSLESSDREQAVGSIKQSLGGHPTKWEVKEHQYISPPETKSRKSKIGHNILKRARHHMVDGSSECSPQELSAETSTMSCRALLGRCGTKHDFAYLVSGGDRVEFVVHLTLCERQVIAWRLSLRMGRSPPHAQTKTPH